MSDQPNTTDPDREWLAESQALITNLRHWISHGLSETAVGEIDDYWRKWQEAREGRERCAVDGVECECERRALDELRDEDKRKVREALKVLDGMTSNGGDEEFVWGAQAAFERLMNARR